MPAAVIQAHSFDQEQRFQGRADVRCNDTLLGKLLLWLLRLPRPGEDLPTLVAFQRDGTGEVWRRTFGDDAFSSHLSPHARQPGHIIERKDAVAAVIRLEPRPDGLSWQVESFRLFGLPLPQFLAPSIEANERDISGRYHFDMIITLPLLGPFIAYKGWLEPEADRADEDAPMPKPEVAEATK